MGAINKATCLSANYFKNLAIKEGKKLASIPLEDKSAVKILTGKNSLDCYVVRKGRLLEVSGFRVKDQSDFLNKTAGILEKIQKLAAKGIDVVEEWGDSLYKNVKDL
jgi:hypothetical protein